MIKAILWDFDGVIVESESLFISLEIEIFKSYGVTLDPNLASQYLGLKLEEYVDVLVNKLKPTLPKDEIIKKILLEIERLYKEGIPLVSHAEEVIRELSKTYTMAIATSRERHLVDNALGRYSLTNCFQEIVSKEDVTRGKPDPEPYLKAIEKLHIDFESLVVVEDAKNGFIAARAAGLKVIARKASHNSHIDFSLAEVIIEDLRKIPIILKTL